MDYLRDGYNMAQAAGNKGRALRVRDDDFPEDRRVELRRRGGHVAATAAQPDDPRGDRV